MRGKNRVCCLTFCLAFFLILGSVTPVVNFGCNYLQPSVIVTEPERVKGRIAGTPHGPIVISYDNNFSDTALAEGWPGDGSSGNPYIIDGLDIDLAGGTGSCISIANTHANFTISNCYLTGALGFGIYLDDVIFGAIVDNVLENNGNNIYLYDCHYMEIRGNTAFDSWYSISLRSGSSFNTIVDNNCSYNLNRGFNFESTSTNNTVYNNIGSNNLYGIVLYYVTYNTVEGNIFNNNEYDGIHVNRAFNNSITQNYCRNNSKGIYLFHHEDQFNEITWNTFTQNYENANDSAPLNTFDYNYYSDYAGSDANEDGYGDTPYVFTSNSDSHPLMFLPTPPGWSEMPVDQNIELGDSFRYDLNATAPSPITWSVDDAEHFTIDDLGVLENSTVLSTGSYELEVVVTNLYGFSISANLVVDVQDTTTTTSTTTTNTTTTNTGTAPPNTDFIVIIVAGIGIFAIIVIVVYKKRS